MDPSLCLAKDPSPDTRNFLLKFWHWITFKSDEDIKKEAAEAKDSEGPRPFYFAADTSYGVKVAWSGTSGPYPDSLKLGYNRKEFASPPIFVDTEGSCVTPKGKPGYEVQIPSFYAAIDNAGVFTTFTESGVEHVQFFATGLAATKFARNRHVQKAVFNDMAPKAAKLEANELGLNQDLIEEIKTAFDGAKGGKKEEILKTAAKLKLVPPDTKSNDFIEVLEEKVHSNSPDPEVSTKLNQVRVVAVKPEPKEAKTTEKTEAN